MAAHSNNHDSADLTARRFDAVLARPWAIIPEALIELTARLATIPPDALTVALPQVAATPTKETPRADMPEDVPGSVAVIPLQGMITPRGSKLMQMLYGVVGGLEAFRAQFREAMADDSVSAIVIDVDSPGGLVDMVPETAAEVLDARGSKPIVAVANTLAASAAYWIASQADELVVTPSGQVGSIGVFTVHEDISRMADMMGVKTTIISAGQYKGEGNPFEPLSKSAITALQDQVDEIYGMFTAAVASGRGVAQEAVAAGYGEGRCLLADRALQVGMVDRIDTLEAVVKAHGGEMPASSGEIDEPMMLCASEHEPISIEGETIDETVHGEAVETEGETGEKPANYLGPRTAPNYLDGEGSPSDYLDAAPAWSV